MKKTRNNDLDLDTLELAVMKLADKPDCLKDLHLRFFKLWRAGELPMEAMNVFSSAFGFQQVDRDYFKPNSMQAGVIKESMESLVSKIRRNWPALQDAVYDERTRTIHKMDTSTI